MNINTYIKNKNTFDRLINDLANSQGYRVVKDPIYDVWKLFNKDILVINIQMEIMDSMSLVEIIFPICDNIGITEEIFLKPIVAEHDFRELLGADTIRRNGDKIEIYRLLKIDNRERYGSNKLLLNISDMLINVDRISQELQSKLDIVMQIKLN